MNKQKQEKIKGILLWLKGRVGTGAGALISETNPQGRLESDFQEFLAHLKKNKRKHGRDPARRTFQDDLRREFEDSMGSSKAFSP